MGSKVKTEKDSNAVTSPKTFDIFDIVTYEDTLVQGDIINKCPYIYTNHIDPENENNNRYWIQYNNSILMSQTCDIDKDKIDLALLCPIWKTSSYFINCAFRFNIDKNYQAKFKNNKEGKSEKKAFVDDTKNLFNNARYNKMNAYHMLKGCIKQGLESEAFLIDFGNMYTLPLRYLKEFTITNPYNRRRLRLKTDYRADLIARFNYFILRGALPDGYEIESADVKYDESLINGILDKKVLPEDLKDY